MKFRPLFDRVVVKRDEKKEKTEGGIFLPDTAKEQPTHATVVAVGPGKRKDDGTYVAPEIKPGDRVWFTKYVGAELEVDGEKLFIVREEDVVGVFEATERVSS